MSPSATPNQLIDDLAGAAACRSVGAEQFDDIPTVCMPRCPGLIFAALATDVHAFIYRHTRRPDDGTDAALAREKREIVETQVSVGWYEKCYRAVERN